MAEHNQQFDSFQQWVNKASSWLCRRGPGVSAICFDARGRVCRMGGDFMRARDEDSFPVRWIWPEQAASLALSAQAHLNGAHDAFLDIASTNLATEVVSAIGETSGEVEERNVVNAIHPIIRRTLSALILTETPKALENVADAINVVDLANEIIAQVSDGWGEEEDRRAAATIRPILRQTIGTAAASLTLIDVDGLASQIVRALSEGWVKEVETRAAEEIKPILRRRLGPAWR